MVAVPLGQSVWLRRVARTPKISLTNMYLEKDQTNLIDGLSRLQRPGLAPWQMVGTGPIRDVFQQLGTFGGDYIVCSGAELYRVTQDGAATLLGAITGSGPVVIAASQTRAIVATGVDCFSTDGASVVQVNMPAGESVLSVCFINEYFLLTVADTQELFWLAPGDVDPDALNFFSAEFGPDNLVAATRISDQLYLFGNSTIEVWVPGSDINLPFTRIEGMLFEKGCASTYTLASLDNTLFWVGNDRMVYRAESVPVDISNPSINEQLRNADPTQLRAWAFAFDGHTFYCLTILGVGTFAYDVSTGEWSEFSTYGQQNWVAHFGAQANGSQIIGGDFQTGQLYFLDATRSNDNGLPFVRELTGGIPIIGPPMPCDTFSVFLTTGWAPITGPAANPLLQMRMSDDGGELWSSWMEISLKVQGKYRGEVTFFRLGQIESPGRVFQLRMTDDTLYRVSYARMNEALAA